MCGGLFSSVLFERCCVNCGILPYLPPGTLSAQVGFVEFYFASSADGSGGARSGRMLRKPYGA